jgi:hypothetical protein
MLFVLSPVFALNSAGRRRKKIERLQQDIVDGMPWTMTHLRPDVIAVGDPMKMGGRYTTVAFKTGQYCLTITREHYYGGEDFCADISPSCGASRRWRIDLVARALDEAHHWDRQPELLLRSLSDLDFLVRSLDPLLRDAVSPQNLDKTRKTVEDYITHYGKARPRGLLSR